MVTKKRVGRPRKTETTATAKQAKRERKRSPVSGRRFKLNLPPEVTQRFHDAGWHLCWVGERYLPEYKSSEYVHVTQEELDGQQIGAGDTDEAVANPGSVVSRYTGRDEHGKREDSYLMKLPLEFWEEDQAALLAQTQEVEDAIEGHLSDSPTGYARTGDRAGNRGF